MAGTLGDMKARLVRDLRRGNTIDVDIADAIADAIDAYRNEGFWWAQSRTAAVFNTTADQAFYDESEEEALGRVIRIDLVTVTIGTQPYKLTYLRPKRVELLVSSSTKGQPFNWTWYEEQLQLYPTPSAAFAMRVMGLFSVAAPATDGATGNPWMVKGARLIRARAKLELAVHRLKDESLAQEMASAVEDAYSQLKAESAIKTGHPQSRVEPFW